MRRTEQHERGGGKRTLIFAATRQGSRLRVRRDDTSRRASRKMASEEKGETSRRTHRRRRRCRRRRRRPERWPLHHPAFSGAARRRCALPRRRRRSWEGGPLLTLHVALCLIIRHRGDLIDGDEALGAGVGLMRIVDAENDGPKAPALASAVAPRRAMVGAPSGDLAALPGVGHRYAPAADVVRQPADVEVRRELAPPHRRVFDGAALNGLELVEVVQGEGGERRVVRDVLRPRPIDLHATFVVGVRRVEGLGEIGVVGPSASVCPLFGERRLLQPIPTHRRRRRGPL